MSRDAGRVEEEGRGRQAGRPTEISAQGWKDVLWRVKSQVKEDNVPLTAAGVAFYSIMSLVPALVAVVSLYGLIAGPAEVQRQLSGLTGALPRDMRSVLENLLTTTASRTSTKLGLG